MSKEQTAIANVDVKREGLRINKWSELRMMAEIAAGARLAATVEEAAARVKYGTELGLGPMMALTNVYIVEGRPTLSATAIGSQIKRAPGYDYRILEHTAEVCRIEGFRNGESLGVADFSMEDAERAGLLGRKSKTWEKYPRNMLFARAIANLARFQMPELFHGSVYSTDEMRDLAGDAEEAAPTVTVEQAEVAIEEAKHKIEAEKAADVEDAVFDEIEKGDEPAVKQDERQAEPPASDEAAPLPVAGPAPEKDLRSIESRLRHLGIPEEEWPQTIAEIFGDNDPTPVSALSLDEVTKVRKALADSNKWKRGAK